MASFLGSTADQFARRYCRSVWWRTSLKELANGDCVLLGPEGCTVYAVRPTQCRTFPFWSDNLEARRDWDDLKARCPGIDHGRLYTRSEIERIMKGERAT